jgi:hypothetical protein
MKSTDVVIGVALAAIATLGSGTAYAQGGAAVAATSPAPEAAPPKDEAGPVDPAAQPLLHKYRYTYTNLTGARVNPLGFENRFTIGYEQRIWDDPGILKRDAYFGLKLAPILNPALARLGVQAEVKPLAVIALRAGIFYKQYFGTFAQLDGFRTPTAEHTDSGMKDRDEAGLTVGKTTGVETEIGALLQAKVGPIALRNDTALYYSDVVMPIGNTVYYDQRIDMVVPDGGYSLTNDTDVLYVTEFGLAAGARLSTANAFYRDSDYLDGEPIENPNTPYVRLGPAVAYTFFDKQGAGFNKPTVLLLSQWWLEHRYRAGQDISQALPCITLAFRFEGELWGRND